MRKNLENLKKHEKEIVLAAYKIALVKQDLALNIIDTVMEVMKKESNTKITKEEIADKVFENIKKIPNKKIYNYIKANIKEKPKLKLKIEKEIIEKIRKKN